MTEVLGTNEKFSVTYADLFDDVEYTILKQSDILAIVD